MKKSPIVCGILASLILTACVPENKDGLGEIDPSETTAAQTEASVSELSETTSEETTTTVSEVTEASKTEAETGYGEYVYTPPREVLDTHFYCDDIEAKIVCQNVLEDDFDIGDIWNDPEAEKALYEALTKNLPAEIVDNVMQNYQSPYDSEKYSDKYKVDEIFYMKYDIDSDGEDDYYLNVSLKEGADFFMSEDHFERIFISDSGSFVPVEIPWLESTRLSCLYFLSTKTNVLKDIFVYHNSNTPSMKYDGISAYGGAVGPDEMHTFLKVDMLSDNILHLNMNISVIDAPLGEYCTAIKFADNPYIKNNLLYTCYPDGTPRSYIEKPYGEWLPTDFNPSQEGYDFYVELDKDAMDTISIDDFQDNIWSYLDLLEIKYVAVNENQE